MPTYDYACDACGHTFEEWQSFNDAELTKCPACKKKKLRRLISGGAAIIFKGSGFYETDYRKESYKDDAKADAAKTEPGKTEPGKTESGKTEPAKSDDAKPVAETKSEPAPASVEKPKAESKPKTKPK